MPDIKSIDGVQVPEVLANTLTERVRLVAFRDLPAPAQLALVFYKAIDGEAWRFPGGTDVGDHDSAHRRAATKHLEHFVANYGDVHFLYGEVPTPELCAVVADDDEIRADHADFAAYHAWYLSEADVPVYPATDRWPVLLLGEGGESIEDGWHRFHSYVRSGHPSVPVLYEPATRAPGQFPNTALHYLYRDASNYKQRGTVVFAGTLTPTQAVELSERLEGNDDGFIPSQVRLPDLQPTFGGLNGDDHVFHEVEDVEPTADAPTDLRTAEAFFNEVMAVAEWDVEAAMERLGLVDAPMVADGGPDMSEYPAYAEKAQAAGRRGTKPKP